MSRAKNRFLAGILTASFLAVATPALAQDTATLPQQEQNITLVQAADTVMPEVDVESMREWRHDFHKHPELAYEEFRTAEKINDLLQSWGIETHTNIGVTGVIGVLKSDDADENSPSICLRADIDALPITEANQDLPHASVYDGVMHACGHDGHTAMLLGAAKHLSETKNFTGTVYFIFQPAEEGGAGAQAMIDDGLFDIVDCKSIYGLHAWPYLEAGQVGLSEGYITANSDRFTVKITGKGGHAAYPANNIDIVAMAAELITALHAHRDTATADGEDAVLAVTKIQGGEALNAMPETLELGGSVRTFGEEMRSTLEKGINDLAQELAEKYGATVEVSYNRGYPSVYNSAEQTQNLREIANALFGEENVKPFTQTMGAEDFSYYTQHIPGAFLALGQWDGESERHPLHSPHFDFNDDVLKYGASLWVNLIEAQMPAIAPSVEPPVKPEAESGAETESEPAVKKTNGAAPSP
ncbi:MAG: amidohydrolase [Micavibrio sp.]|nr:MAG: amidohydrolase [Micavibrio sp.]